MQLLFYIYTAKSYAFKAHSDIVFFKMHVNNSPIKKVIFLPAVCDVKKKAILTQQNSWLRCLFSGFSQLKSLFLH